MRRLITAVQTSLIDYESSLTSNSVSELRSAVHRMGHGFHVSGDDVDAIIVHSSWMLAIVCVCVMAQFGPRTVRGFLYSATWFTCACVVSTVNKAALRRLAAPACLAVLYISVAILVTLLHRPWRTMWAEIRKQRHGLIPCILLGIVAGMALVTGLGAQNAEDVPTFVILQNLGPVVVFFVEPWLSSTRSHFTFGRSAAFGLVCGGSLVYGGHQDFSKTAPALPYAAVSLLSMAIYTLGMRAMLSIPGFDLSVPTITLIQNVLGLFPVVVFFLHGQEWLILRRFAEGLNTAWNKPYYDAVLLISAFVYTGLFMTSVQIRGYVTATNFTVLESAARALQVALALAFFGNRPVSNWVGTVGCAMCIIGSFLFTRLAQSDKLPGGESPYTQDDIAEEDRVPNGSHTSRASSLIDCDLHDPYNDSTSGQDEEVRSNVSNVSNVEFDARTELLLGPSDSSR